MRPVPPTLAAHLAGQATTICRAWRVTRSDGQVLGFTDHDRDLAFGGTHFSAASGFQASEVESALGLSVEGAEVAGAFSDAAISERDLAEGRFDGARVELFAVNWAAPDDHLLLHVHELGEVTRAGQAFRAELRSLAHRLDAVKGRVYGRRCDADLGDARCGVDLSDPQYRAEGTVIAATGKAAVLVSGLDGLEPGWFRHGFLHWTAGANAGLKVEILDHRVDADGVRLDFWMPVANRPEPGDAFTVTAGCSKSFETCRKKFSNQLNFRGFPHLPGSDFAYGYADGDTVHDGRPLVE